MPYRIRVLGGGLELDFPGRPIEPPTAPAELGVLMFLALHPGHELGIDAFKIALYDCEPGGVSNATIQTPMARLRRAGLPIPQRHYVLEMDPSEVDIVDVDTRARAFIEATAHPQRLGEDSVRALVQLGSELHELWQHDPAEAVGHRPLLSQLFEPFRHRHRRFGVAFVRLLAATGDTARAFELLAEYVDRYGDDAAASELRQRLREVIAGAPPPPEIDHNLAASAPDPVEWPLQIGRPPARSRAFQSREGLAAQLVSGAAGHGSQTPSQVVVIGGGGVGKTQLAAAAFATARDKGVELLVWVNASSRASILTTYAHARDETEPNSRGSQSATDAAEGFLGWLGVTSRSWMIVLDDVTDPADLRGLWPEGRRGRVVATTRRRDLAPARARQVPVDVFTPSEARSYLVDRFSWSSAQLTHPRVLDEADELAADLGWLPVALAQAAAVILNDGITCAEYRGRVADRSGGLDRLFPNDARADDYASTVAATWSLSIELADRLPPVGLAEPVLQIAAVLDPNGAPDTLWATPPVQRFLHDPSAENARTTLRNLHRVSLLKHDPGGGPHAVITHALTQRATLEALTPPRRAEIVHVAADALSEIWPEAETDPAFARVLRQNVATLARNAEDALWSEGPHEVLFLAGQSLGEVGLAQDAIAYWTDLGATATRRLGPDHHRTLAIRHALADWRGVAGDPTEAVDELRELLDDRSRVLGADHPDTLASRHGLAHWQGAAGDASGAIEALEELLGDRLRVLGADHPDTLTTRHTLADWTGLAGDARRAARTFDELRDHEARVLGAEHRAPLTTRRHLAFWQGAAGDADAAVATLGQLLDDSKLALGPDHPDTLATRAALAEWQGAAGDVSGAAKAFEQLHDDCLRLLGPDHPDTLAARHGAADWRGATGDAAGAAREFEQLSRDRSRALGLDHPATFTTRAGLAYWHGVAGDPAAAARLLHRVVEDRTRLLGPNHVDTLVARHTLAYWQGAAGDAAGAVTALERLRDDYGRTLGSQHPYALATRHTLAYWQGATGDIHGAVTTLERLRDDCRRLLGPRHPHTLAASEQIAHWTEVAGAGDSADADAAMAQLREEQMRILGPGRPHTLALRHGLADWRTGRVRRHLAPWSSPGPLRDGG